MNYRYKTRIFFVAVIFLTSCKKMIEIDPPTNQVITSQVFEDSANSNAAVLGMYIRMMGSAFSFSSANGAVTAYTGLSADELTSTTGNPSENEFFTNSLNQENSTLAELWKNAYTIIYQSNALIEGLAASKTLSPTLKSRFAAEAKLVRSFIYFNLVQLFGDVPYVNTTDYAQSSLLARTAKEEIYRQLVSDLLEAKNDLPVSYPAGVKIRPSKAAAEALLARIYLSSGQWNEAETISSAIINSGIYQLNSDLGKIFEKNSNEAIWQLPPAQPGGFETTEGMQFVPFSSGVLPKYPISNYLLNAFETNDQRKSKWLSSNTVNGQFYYFPFKYKLNYTGGSSPQEYYMIFRLAEQYLIRAEARARLNKLNESISEVNTIRNRAGLTDTSVTTSDELLAVILHERQIEFFCEWGHRWYDLKRMEKVDLVMAAVKGQFWQPSDKLFPVPFREMQLNPFLTQNSGY